MDGLQALAGILTALSDNPLDIGLHIQHITLASESQAGDEQAAEAREMMTGYWAAGDEVWMPLIDAKIRAIEFGSVEGAQEIHELFDRAEGDYLCACLCHVLHQHVNSVV
jgi:hypothetical protein